MSDPLEDNLNKVMKEIIKNSLFTERQIEIISKRRNLSGRQFAISRGAFYRQVAQCQAKFQSFCYSWILLKALGILREEDITVINRLAEQVSVIKNSDVFPEREDQVIYVIHELLERTCKL
ncbi:MAG: hypothetical protein KGI33_09665 [Thaumarchaeota archaeon]|nr:hypothetical protein [Nitrososphaerota archaeon]